MKRCFKCGKEKSLNEYYKHSQMADGHLNKCKDCTKKDAKNQYDGKITDADFRESERSRGRDKYRRLYAGTAKADMKRSAKYAIKYPEKQMAKNYSSNLLPTFDGAERHHWSYLEEHFKDVIWLSKKDHMKSHRFIVYDQERRMYRRVDNNELLDSKDSHLKYIIWCIKNKED